MKAASRGCACRQEQIAESVDDVFCLRNDEVDTASATRHEDAPVERTGEVLEQSASVGPRPERLDSDLDASGEADSDKVDSAAGLTAESEPGDGAVDETTHGGLEMVSAADEGDTGCRSGTQNILQDPLSGAKRLPKAAANILRMPIDSIWRRDCESKDSQGSASGDEAGETTAADSPAAAGPGLMSRTLGSITALPSLFVKSSTDSGGAAASTPSPTRSTPVDKSDRSPSSTKPRTFFFHRFVGKSVADSSTTDANRTADDGICHYRL